MPSSLGLDFHDRHVFVSGGVVDDVGLEIGEQRLHGAGVADISDARLKAAGCGPEAGAAEQAEVVERCLCDVDGEHFCSTAFEGLHHQFRADRTCAACHEDAGVADLVRDGGGVEFDDGPAQQVFDAGVPELAGTQFSLNPALCRRDIHDAQPFVQSGIDDLGFADRVQPLNGNDQPLGVVVSEHLGGPVCWEDGNPVDALAVLATVVIEKGHHFERVRTGPFHGLLGDDARFTGAKDDHRCGARGLEALIDGPHRDTESDEEYRSSEKFNRHHAQRHRIGHVHGGRGKVLAQKQQTAHAQCEQYPTGIPRTAEPDDASIRAEDQHREGPDQNVSGDEAPSRLQFMGRRGKFKPDRKCKPQCHQSQRQVDGKDHPARYELGFGLDCAQQLEHPERQDTAGGFLTLLFGTKRMDRLTFFSPQRGWLSFFRNSAWFALLGAWALPSGVMAQSEETFEMERTLTALSKAVAVYDKDAERFLEKELKPLLLDPAADSAITGVFVERLAQIDAANLGVFPEQFGYARSVQAALSGDSLRLPFAAWDEAVSRSMERRRSARDFGPVLALGKDLLLDGTFYQSKSVRWAFEGPMAISITDQGEVQFVFGPSGNLLALAKGDTLLVQQTGGVYDFSSERFEGRSGRVDWGRSGWDPAKNYADFDAYSVRLKTASLTVDSARFTTELFPDPLLGQLTDKARVRKRNEASGAATDAARYPRFDTYINRLSMPNLVPGVDFEGGLTVRGAELQGKGNEETPAILRFRRGDTVMVECRSSLFILRADQFSGQGVEAVLHLEGDSLYHPELNVRFNLDAARLFLIRTDEGLGPRPFSDSYHKLFIDCNVLSWGMEDTRIRLEGPPGSVQSTAVLTSFGFFNKGVFRDMQGIDPVHPLVRVRNHVKATGDSTFSSTELGMSLRLSEPKTRAMMIRMAHEGYLEMDLETRMATAADKLFDDLANAAGRRDYDVLFFRSEASGSGHGEISLLNRQLTLNGVARVDVSRDRGVLIEPRNGKVVIGEDRDFTFGGGVRAGNLQFDGSDYAFDYESFSIELNAVESCKLRVNEEEKDARGRPKRKLVKNRLEYVQGVLRVDVPINRSGRLSEAYPQYPVLVTDEPSYVYWNDEQIENGAYEKDRFRFVVEPFTLDSLDALGRQELVFSGTLESGDLLPPLQEDLRVMDDLHLGFTTATPSGGYQVYGGVGTFDQNLTLDGGGLQGGGRLDFRTAHAESDRFVLLPDSTKGLAQVFSNTESAGPPPVPETQGEGVDVLFEPRSDRISARTQDIPMRLFEGEAELQGGIVLGTEGMTGDGEMRFSGAVLGSQLFRFRRRHILADTARFQLDQRVEGALAFKTDNVHCDIDFDARVGEFASNDGETKIELPANQYMCYMDEFKWYMDKDEMEMTSSREPLDDFVIDSDEASSSSNFYSTRNDQDSLNFLSPTAVYDVSEAVLRCEDVKFIRTADAFVEPDSGRVVVRRRAQMDQLTRAVIVANVVSRHHRLFDAEVNIMGRFDYEARASTFYKDENGLEQLIEWHTVEVDTSGETVGKGTIPVQDGSV